MIPHRSLGARQIGGALLASLLVALLATASLLLAEAASRREPDPSREARQALNHAKQALIHYAITDANRPGELPCPDVDHDGKLRLNVDFFGGRDVPCATLRGWLPHATLGLQDLRDATGQQLWYALTDSYHAGHSAVLNSQTPGGLSVGGVDDVVAVIIAPSSPIDVHQAELRARGGQADARSDVIAYLEGDNADADLTHYAVAGNDRLAVLTRGELMAMTEQRVLAEYVQLLSRHRAETGAFPWLAPLGDPRQSAFKATLGTHAGYLSLHLPRERFETAELQLEWSLVGGRMTHRGSVAPGDLSDGDHHFVAGDGPSGYPECVYTNSLEIECIVLQDLRGDCNGVPDTPIRRRYTVEFTGEIWRHSRPTSDTFGAAVSPSTSARLHLPDSRSGCKTSQLPVSKRGTPVGRAPFTRTPASLAGSSPTACVGSSGRGKRYRPGSSRSNGTTSCTSPTLVR